MYYYQTSNREKIGPLSREEFWAKVFSGEIESETLVARGNCEKWERWTDVVEKWSDPESAPDSGKPKKLSTRAVLRESVTLIRKQWLKLFVCGLVSLVCWGVVGFGFNYLEHWLMAAMTPSAEEAGTQGILLNEMMLIFSFLFTCLMSGWGLLVICLAAGGILTISRKTKCGEPVFWRDVFPIKRILRRFFAFLGWVISEMILFKIGFGIATVIFFLVFFFAWSGGGESAFFGGLAAVFVVYFLVILYCLARLGFSALFIFDEDWKFLDSMEAGWVLSRGNTWAIMRFCGIFSLAEWGLFLLLIDEFSVPGFDLDSVLFFACAHFYEVLTLLFVCESYLQLRGKVALSKKRN